MSQAGKKLCRAKLPLMIVLPWLSFLFCAPVQAQSSDWTQWGGPHRNFVSDVKGLADAWPAGGPRQLWKRELGEGYSSIVVDNGKLYTLYRKDEQEVVIALDAASGKTIWEHPYPAPIHYEFKFGPGPRATPLIIGNSIFTVGASGIFHCLDKQTGKAIWSHDLLKEFNGYEQEHLYASSPLAYKNTVIVPVGAEGGSIMAFNQKDGAVVWKKLDFKTGYAAPILITVDGQEQVVAFMEDDIIGINPNNGDLLWSHPHKANTSVNSSTPIWGNDNLLFCSSAYDGGSRMLKLAHKGDKTTVEEVWYQRLMRMHFSIVMRIGDVLYGSSGDFGPTPFTAVDAKTGKVLWRDRSVSKVEIIYADGKFIMLDEDGNLILAKPTAEGLKIISQAPILVNNAWTPPTLAGTKLYARDRKMIVAVDLK